MQVLELHGEKRKPPKKFASLHCPVIIFVNKIIRRNCKSIGAQLSTAAIKQIVDNQLQNSVIN